MTTPLVVRPYSHQDRTAVAVVLEAVAHANPGYPFQLSRERDALDAWLIEADDAQRFVAERDGVVVGHAQLSSVSPYIAAFCRDAGVDPNACVEMGRVFVDPYLPRSGVGRALVQHVTGVVAQSGKQLILLVPEHQHGAVALYEAEGWTTSGSRRIEVRGESVDVRFMLGPVRSVEPPGVSR